MDILDQKKELRKKMMSARTKIESSYKKEYDEWICNELKKQIDQHFYETIHVYLPMWNEINITPLIKDLLAKGKTIVAPKTLPKRVLENRILTSFEEIEKGVFGTTHPSNPVEYTGTFDLIIVPGLAFDKDNYRLGYGGGYYDNFIVKHPTATKIGIFYPIQKVEKVPREPHDFRLDSILIKND